MSAWDPQSGSSGGGGGGTISRITSTGGSIIVSSPTGPTTNIEAATYLPPVMWTTLGSSVSAGADAIDVATVLPEQTQLLAQAGTHDAYYIVVGAFTTEAELVQVNYSGAATTTHLITTNLAKSHPSGAVVLLVEDEIYAEWFGVVRTLIYGDVIAGNGVAFQNMLSQQVAPGLTYKLGPGYWSMDSQVVTTTGTGVIDGAGGVLFWPVDLGVGFWGLYIDGSQSVKNLQMIGPGPSYTTGTPGAGQLNYGTDPNCMSGLHLHHDCVVDNVIVQNFRKGFTIDFHDHCRITNCESNVNFWGVYFSGRTDGGDSRWIKFKMFENGLASVGGIAGATLQATTYEDSTCGSAPYAFDGITILLGTNFKRISFENMGNALARNSPVNGVTFGAGCYFSPLPSAFAIAGGLTGALFVYDGTVQRQFTGVTGDLSFITQPLVYTVPGAGHVTVIGDVNIDAGATPSIFPYSGSKVFVGFNDNLEDDPGLMFDIKLKVHHALTGFYDQGTASTFFLTVGSSGTDGYATNGSTAFTAASGAFSTQTSIAINGVTYPIASVTNSTTIVLAWNYGGTTTTTATWACGPVRGDLIGAGAVCPSTGPANAVLLEPVSASTDTMHLGMIDGTTRANVLPANSVAANKYLKPDSSRPGCVKQAADFTDGPIVGYSVAAHVDNLTNYGSTRTVWMKLTV